jgi:hypothetical protein
MGTLTAHLRRTGDHGALPFHPDCPVCLAERLSGTLHTQTPTGRRTQAAVVAAMLAASTASPTVAVAQEADQVTEGVAPEGSSGDRAVTPEFDPGGADEGLEIDESEAVVPDTAPAPAESAPAPPEAGPVAETDVPVANAVVPAPVSPSSPLPTRPALQHLEQNSAPAGPVPELVARVRVKPKPTSRNVHPAPESSANEGQAVPRAQTQPTETVPPTASVSVKREQGAGNARHHVVRPGESLWSIAREVLGGEPSPARIAREVNVLWDLNSAQIATGDPDMLRVGTKLSLR